jgi:hypothetical protein
LKNVFAFSKEKTMLTIQQIQSVLAYFEGLVVIMYGLSGSGKSYETKRILQVCQDNDVPAEQVSTDSFFEDEKGEYHFDPSKLKENHEKAKLKFASLLGHCNVIVVDNTNMVRWEWSEYAEHARKMGYFVCLRSTEKALDVDFCFPRNTHNVPKETLIRRREQHLKKPFYPTYAGLFFNPSSVSTWLKLAEEKGSVGCKPVSHPHVTLLFNGDGKKTERCKLLDTLDERTFVGGVLFVSRTGTVSLHGSVVDDTTGLGQEAHVTLAVRDGVKPVESGRSYNSFVQYGQGDENPHGVAFPLGEPAVLKGVVSAFW